MAKVIEQYWTQKLGKIWHVENKFNLVGEHVTLINFGKYPIIESVFCIRNSITSCTIKLVDSTTFNFPVIKGAYYLDCHYEITEKELVKVTIPLDWYMLTYSYQLFGTKFDKSF